MNIFVGIIGRMLLAAVCGIPVIFCIFRMAGFKNRSKVMWVSISILASVPVSLFVTRPTNVVSGLEISASIPIFIILTLLPLLHQDKEKKTYSIKFITKYDNKGYIFAVALAIVLIGIFYFQLYKTPMPPVLQSGWLHIHAPLGLIAYSAIFTIFVLCFLRLLRNSLFPIVALRLQIFALITFFLCVVSGAIWAENAWGSYWNWDPKQTWSLIFLYILAGAYTYFVRSVPSKGKGLITAAFQMAIVIFIMVIMPILIPGLHTYRVF